VDDVELIDRGNAGGDFFDGLGDSWGAAFGEGSDVEGKGGADDQEGDSLFLGLEASGGGVAGVGDHHGFVGVDVALDAEQSHDVAELDVPFQELGVCETEEVADAIVTRPVEIDLVADVLAGCGWALEVAGLDVVDWDCVFARQGVPAEGFVLPRRQLGSGVLREWAGGVEQQRTCYLRGRFRRHCRFAISDGVLLRHNGILTDMPYILQTIFACFEISCRGQGEDGRPCAHCGAGFATCTTIALTSPEIIPLSRSARLFPTGRRA
jgi:hypothetical protein